MAERRDCLGADLFLCSGKYVMGRHQGSTPARPSATDVSTTADETGASSDAASSDGSPRLERRTAVRARQQVFGFVLLGTLCCLAAFVFTLWSPQQNPGRWFWSIVGTLAGVVCLIKAHRTFGGEGADRDASPYYGMFAGVTSGALLLLVLSVEGWVLPTVFFVMAAILAFMAWVEQSTIGMTAAVCVAVLCAGSGVAVLNDAATVGLGSLALGLMLLVGATAIGMVEEPVS